MEAPFDRLRSSRILPVADWIPNNRAFPLKVAVGNLDAAMETYKMQHIPLVDGQKVGRHQREGNKEKPNEEQ